jgi:hypothetical protein
MVLCMKLMLLMVVGVFVVMVSGCPEMGDVGGSSFAMGNGLQINSFEFKPAKLVSGQATLLKLDVQNMGSLGVEDIYVNLYGLSNEWYESGECSMVGEVSDGCGQDTFELQRGLRAANAEFKTEGQKEVVVWKFTSPEEHLPGTEFAHRAYVRVCYPYETHVLAKVEVVGEDEWLVMEQTGKFSQHPISVKQTAAPVQIHIESMQPVIVDSSFSMELKVSNVGGGVAFSGTVCSDAFNAGSEVEVAVDLNNVGIEGLPSECEVFGKGGDNLIMLSRGQERTVSVKCEGDAFSSVMPKQEFDLDITLSYSYYIDAETSVVLVGVEGDD